jgi:hypothetical protein
MQGQGQSDKAAGFGESRTRLFPQVLSQQARQLPGLDQAGMNLIGERKLNGTFRPVEDDTVFEQSEIKLLGHLVRNLNRSVDPRVFVKIRALGGAV